MFIAVVQDLGQGTVSQELDAKLRELVQAVMLSGKGGKISVSLEVKPSTKTDVEAVMVKPQVTCKLPDFHRQQIFFPDENFNLERKHPAAQEREKK